MQFKINNLTIKSPLILAPMSGVTNCAFRELIAQTNPDAVGLFVTEFISIEALTRQNPKCFQMMKYTSNQRPISVQIFGYDLKRMVLAAKMAEDAGADIVDINSGCPAPKVVRKGGGCELMRQPQHVAKLLSSVTKEIKIPLTLKIRAGWDSDSRNALEIAKLAEESGVSMLAIHGRTKAEGYRGFADWDIIGNVAEELSIPVVGSGDVTDIESAKRSLQSGVKGLMIGRAALSNPWVFREIHEQLHGRKYEIPSYVDTIDLMQHYLELLLKEMPEKGAIGKMKQIASQVTRRVPGSKPIRHKLTRSQSLTEFNNHLEDWRSYLLDKSYDPTLESNNSKHPELLKTNYEARTC